MSTNASVNIVQKHLHFIQFELVPISNEPGKFHLIGLDKTGIIWSFSGLSGTWTSFPSMPVPENPQPQQSAFSFVD